VWAHFAGQEPELMTDIDPMRLVGHLKNLLRYGLTLCVCGDACAVWCVRVRVRVWFADVDRTHATHARV
jgi:hypothetical protein